jgi:hypothetical protein
MSARWRIYHGIGWDFFHRVTVFRVTNRRRIVEHVFLGGEQLHSPRILSNKPFSVGIVYMM